MPSDTQPIRFGTFEVNLETGEIRRNGTKVRLQEQPFQVLAALLEKPGKIVTKEELQERIWKDDTFVDFDRSLATAINKVRQALGDSATRPRFIETVPKRGYRFVGLETAAQTIPGEERRSLRKSRYWLAGAAALVAAILVLWATGDRTTAVNLTFSAARPFTTDIGYELSPSFSPDGNQIVYSWDRLDQRGFDLYSGLVGSASRLQLTDTPENEYSPTWSPDGLRIAFVREMTPSRLGIYVMPAIGGAEQFVAEVAGRVPQTPVKIGMALMLYPTVSWTPDGEWLLTTDRESEGDEFEPVLISIGTGKKRGIGEDNWGRTAAISPSGDALALVAYDLMTISLSEAFEPRSEATRLASFTMALGRPAWTPDGRNLLVTGVPDDESLSVVRLVPLDGSPARRILEFGENVAHPTFSPTGRLAFVRRMNIHDVWTLDLEEPTRAGAAKRVIASTYTDMNPEFSFDGSKIVFVSSRSGNDEIWVADQDGSNLVRVTNSGEEGVGSPAWSPDGLHIAFDGYAEPQKPIETSQPYRDWDVMIVRSDGGGVVRRLTFDGGNGAAAWSRDGKWIYYSHFGSAPRGVYRVAVEGGEVELVAEDAFGTRLSPDGEWVYFGRQGQLWREPVAGGPEEVVVEELAGPVAVTNEGAYFVSRTLGNGEAVIAYRDFASGGTTEIYQTPKRLHAWLDISADGKRLIFNQLDQEGSDIMVVDDFLR